MNKRYYWLKLKNDFFKDKRIKKLRKIAGGDTYTIIYLKMQLLSLQDEGVLYYDGVEDTFEEEIALQIDEDVEDVKITIGFLLRHGLLKQDENNEYQLPETIDSIGSETASTIRSRKSRALKKDIKMLQCNNGATKCNIEIDIEKDIDIDNNNMNIVNNWKDNEICECRTKKGHMCNRRSTYKINNKNYCNQHSKPIISKILENKKYYENEELNKIFIEFLNMRERIKAINSERAINTLLNKLSKYDDKIKYQMIEKSIVNSWKDVYELKNNNKKEAIIPKWFNQDLDIQEDSDCELENILNEIGG